MLKYPTLTGEPVLLTLRDDRGEALPVGAEVLDAKGNSLTLVGQGSRVFIRAAEREGELTVPWGEGRERECRVRYQLPAAQEKNASAFIKAEALCSRSDGPTQIAAR